MSFKTTVANAASGAAAGAPFGPWGMAAGAVAGALGGGGGGGGGGVQNAAAATNAALDAETMKAFANQLESARKNVAIQKVNLTAAEVQKAAQ